MTRWTQRIICVAAIALAGLLLSGCHDFAYGFSYSAPVIHGGGHHGRPYGHRRHHNRHAPGHRYHGYRYCY